MRVLAKINKNDPKKKCLLSTFSQHFVDNKFHCFLFSQLFSPFVFVGLSNSSKGKCSSLKTGKCDLTPQKWAWGSSSGNSIRDAFFSLLTANSSWLSNRPPLPACVCSPRAVCGAGCRWQSAKEACTEAVAQRSHFLCHAHLQQQS